MTAVLNRCKPRASGLDFLGVEATPGELRLPGPIGTGSVVRRSAPRLLRDGFGPLAVFYAGWKLLGLYPGIALAAAFGVAVFALERRRGQPAMVVRLALVLVAIRATVGITSASARTYLAQEIGIDTLLGCVVMASLAASRPFAAWFATEIYPLPAELRDSEEFTRAMRRITLVWGAYFFARALVRLTALLTLSTDRYVLVAALSDAPFLVALLAWSVYHTSTVFRRSAQWGPLLVEAGAVPVRSPPHVDGG
jgi:intracellular septation protein A